MSDYYGHGGGVSSGAAAGGDTTGGGGAAATASDGGGGGQPPQQQQQHRNFGGGGAGRGGGGGRGETFRPYKTHHPRDSSNSNANSNNNNNNNNNNSNMDTGKIFVGGLSWQTTEESLRWHFEQYGPVASVEVMRDRNTGDPRGFAFVVFAGDAAATVDIVMAENQHEINHKIVDVKRAQARGIAPPSIHPSRGGFGGPLDGSGGGDGSVTGGGGSVGGGASQQHDNNNNNNNNQQQSLLTPEMAHNKVFVGGLPPTIDRDGLREIMSEYGTVVDAIVMLDQTTKRSRGFGFVTFEAGSNGAQRVVDVQPLQIQGRRVEVKLATPRGGEQQQQQQRRPPNMMMMAGPKHVGLRAGQSSSSAAGEFAGLAVAYGRSGWKAGYGSTAFGSSGWAVQGWEDGGKPIERSGFSFSLLQKPKTTKRVLPKVEDEEAEAEPAAKRIRQ